MVRHNDMLIQFNKMIIRFLNMTNCIFDNLPYMESRTMSFSSQLIFTQFLFTFPNKHFLSLAHSYKISAAVRIIIIFKSYVFPYRKFSFHKIFLLSEICHKGQILQGGRPMTAPTVCNCISFSALRLRKKYTVTINAMNALGTNLS